MPTFSMSIGNMINIIVIAIGIGISGMIILLVSSGAQLRKEVTRYFQLFFGIVILYIGSHLVRQLLEGQPGAGVHYALYGVTLLEFLASGVMASSWRRRYQSHSASGSSSYSRSVFFRSPI